MADRCINLWDCFGTKYRMSVDPAWSESAESRRKLSRVDPWYHQIVCRVGTIFPYGDSRLVAEMIGHRGLAARLRRLDCVAVLLDCDGETAVIFDVADFYRVAEIMTPKKRRQISDAERKRLMEVGSRHRFQSDDGYNSDFSGAERPFAATAG